MPLLCTFCVPSSWFWIICDNFNSLLEGPWFFFSFEDVFFPLVILNLFITYCSYLLRVPYFLPLSQLISQWNITWFKSIALLIQVNTTWKNDDLDLLIAFFNMVFSKSFGYALRSIIYLSIHRNTKAYIQSEEISTNLEIPKHFMSKVLKSLAQSGILNSNKGPSGGFSLKEETLQTPLIKIIQVTKGLPDFTECALHMKKCNARKPCPIHFKVELLRQQMTEILNGNNISDLLQQDQEALLNSITAIRNIPELAATA